jgi:site-specific recombinase XerD
MIEHYFLKPETCDRIRASWLGEPIQRYVTWLHEHGYAARNVFRRVPTLMHFASYAQGHGAKAWADLPDHVEPFVEQLVHERGVNCRDEEARQSLARDFRNPIHQMLRVVLPNFAGNRRDHLPFPFVGEVPGFCGYLQQERGISPNTLHNYVYCLRSLKTYLESVGVANLNELSPPILSAFVTARGQEWGKSALKGLCSSLRVFLTYLHRERLLARDLSPSVQAPKSYRLAGIPRSIPWSDVQRMLEGVDRRTGPGKRDYAILLLLVTYGLRSREVAALTLEDLDWEQERLRVPERKAGHSTAYPLSPIVGEAILDYLKNGRPKTDDRHVFFRSYAPPGPLGAPAVSERAAHYLQRAGVKVPRPGSHTLRHTCVQRLVDAHFSLKDIGDYVGHGSPDSTKIYSKVDVETLREVTLGNGEEVL